MAIVDASQATTFIIDMFNGRFADNATPVAVSASSYTWETTSGIEITAYSLYDDISLPNGTVHAIEAIDPSGNALYSVSGMTGELSSMLIQPGTSLAADYWEPILAGDTTIISPTAEEFFENNPMQFLAVGDFLAVENEMATGGNDVFLGGPGISFFVGDAGDADPDAALVGGDDTFVMHGQADVAGDAWFARQSQVSGGDDTLVLDAPVDDRAPGFVSTELIGDVATASDATIIGGDDTIEVRNVLDIYAVVGDLRDAQSSTLEGGDDTISVRNSVGIDAIYGDCAEGGAGSGGNDIIDLLDLAAVIVSGDFNDLGGAASGGDDEIDLVNSTAIVTGDASLLDVAVDLTAGDDSIDASRSSAGLTLVGDAITARGSGARVFGGADEVRGGSGNDVIVGDVRSLADQATLLAGADELSGGDGDDRIYGEVETSVGGAISTSAEFTGNDVLYGGSGNDQLVGQVGNDTLIGGLGDDILEGGLGGSASGIDTAAYNTVAQAVLVDLQLGTALGQGADTLVDIRNVTGSHLGDGIAGDDAANTLRGLGGNDTLNGRDGNDRLDGGAGADAMQGGSGDDTYVVETVGDTAREGSDGGTDLVQSTITFALSANIENLALNGAAAINGAGNASANSISGNSAANLLSGLGDDDTLIGYGGGDRLDGGTGADAMTGGLGDDTYVVDDAGDTAVEAGGGGADTVQSTVSFTLAAQVETLVLNGMAAIDGAGNALANTIYGNSAVNRLDGNGGNDTLTGFGGADVFVFADGDGADIVADFQNGADLFDLSAVAGMDDIGDLTIVDNGSTVTVDYGAGSFEIANLPNPAALDASDFLF